MTQHSLIFLCICTVVGLSACGTDETTDNIVGNDAGVSSADGAAEAVAVLGLDSLDACEVPLSVFASEVIEHEFGTGQDYGQDEFPDNIFGPPRGAGAASGSFDVVALGNGGEVTLAFGGNAIVDGDGPDFIVFENAFVPQGSDTVFAELATVSVSQDGETFYEFSCTASEPEYGDCAGWRPVLAHAEENDIDATDPELAGGDAFDLADLGLPYVRYVRITDRLDLDSDLDGVFDLDAVALVHPACN